MEARPPAGSNLPDRTRARRALGVVGLTGLGIAAVPLAAPGSGLLPAADAHPPGWLLGLYGEGLGVSPGLYYGTLWLAFASYLCVLYGAPAIERRLMQGAAVLLVAIFALAPPLLSQDVFSYIDYARLGALHELNPYLHSPANFPADPAYPYVGWTESRSAYGPLFTLATYPLAWVSVAAALWALKALAGLSVLALAMLTGKLAPSRGLDSGRALAIVALNPLVLVHVVGGAHNDAIAILAATAGCAGVLALREGSGGAALITAGAVKISTIFVAPFALLGAARNGFAGRFLLGAALAIGAIGVAGTAAFGWHWLEAFGVAGENQGRVSNYSLPNLASELSGIGVDTARALGLGLYMALVGALLLWTWRGADWLRAAGWAALGLLVATAWLLPWYVIWALPLAALSRDGRLIAAVLALTSLQLAARIPL